MDDGGGVEVPAGLVTAKVGGAGSTGLELTSVESWRVRLVLMP